MTIFRKPLRSPRRPAGVRLTLEALEDRRVPAITFHGGTLLTHVEVQPVFLGQDWNSPAYSPQAAQIDTFLGYFVQSSYFDIIGEYGVGQGSLVNNGYVDGSVPSGQKVDDSAIENQLEADINAGSVQAPDPNRLYVVYTAPGVVVTFGSQNSQKDFFGYHNVFQDSAGRLIHYAVVVHPAGNGDFPGLSDFQTLTKVSSHEIAESATDPGALTNLETGGWYGSFPGFSDDQEISDVADGSYDYGTLNGYVVSAVWSNRQQAAVVPYNAKSSNGPAGSAQPSPVPDNLGAVAIQLTHSDEYYANLITQDYQQYLGRTPALAEVQAWIGAMHGGTTDEQLLAGFIGSAEYYQHVGGTNKAWVDAVYNNLLGRAPDAAGEAGWLADLANGLARGQVALGFAQSQEAEGLVVKNDYLRYLGRSATTAEINGWVSAFQAGQSNENVVAGFIGSLEYFLSARKGGGKAAGWISSAYSDLFHRKAATSEVNSWLQAFD